MTIPVRLDLDRYATGFGRTMAHLDQAATSRDTHLPDADHAAVAAWFTPDEVGALLSLIVAINAWNALSVASRSWTPEVAA